MEHLSSRLGAALGVTKFTTIIAMNLATLKSNLDVEQIPTTPALRQTPAKRNCKTVDQELHRIINS